MLYVDIVRMVLYLFLILGWYFADVPWWIFPALVLSDFHFMHGFRLPWVKQCPTYPHTHRPDGSIMATLDDVFAAINTPSNKKEIVH